MPYSRTELLSAWRQDHPELAKVSDNELFAAITLDHPDLTRGISEPSTFIPEGPPAPPKEVGWADILKRFPGQLAESNLNPMLVHPLDFLAGKQTPDYNKDIGQLGPQDVQAQMMPLPAPSGLGAGLTGAGPAVYSPLTNVTNALSDAIKSRFPGAKASAQAGFNALSQKIGSEVGDYASAKPFIEEAQKINRISKSYVPGPMKGAVAQDILKNQPVTFDEARIAASRAGQLSQFETARTDSAMLHRLRDFARSLDENNRNLAVKNGMGEIYDSAMSDWAKYKGSLERSEYLAKWVKRIALYAALGGVGGTAARFGYGAINDWLGK